MAVSAYIFWTPCGFWALWGGVGYYYDHFAFIYFVGLTCTRGWGKLAAWENPYPKKILCAEVDWVGILRTQWILHGPVI